MNLKHLESFVRVAELGSIPAIINPVCAGTSCAALNASAVAASGRERELAVRPIVEAEIISVLCLAQSATKPPTPLTRQAAALLTEPLRREPHAGRQA